MKVCKRPTSVRSTDMSDLLIQAQDLNTYYGASHILRGVNFSVKDKIA